MSAGRTFTEERYAVESWFFARSRFPERYVVIDGRRDVAEVAAEIRDHVR